MTFSRGFVSRILAGGSVAAMALTLPMVAQAQEAQGGAAEEDDNVIIVTAQKRAEDIQDVSLSIKPLMQRRLTPQELMTCHVLNCLYPV